MLMISSPLSFSLSPLEGHLLTTLSLKGTKLGKKGGEGTCIGVFVSKTKNKALLSVALVRAKICSLITNKSVLYFVKIEKAA